MKYDPESEPPAQAWLRLDEAERIELVRRYHRRAGEKVPRLRVHSTLHATVETQLAMGIPPVRSALTRLMEEGLDRHDAIHAIASVLVWEMTKAVRGESEGKDVNEEYARELGQLTKRNGWRSFPARTAERLAANIVRPARMAVVDQRRPARADDP